MNHKTDVRPSPIAGQWYSSNPDSLASSIDRYMDEAALPWLDGQVIGVIAPHAGHLYSGPVAGYAFAALRGMQPEAVVVVSPMHYPYYEPLLSTAHEAYHTPLGDIPVDREALNKLDRYLEESLSVGLERVRRDPEHSLEIELPFLQRALAGPFNLIPVMIVDPGVRTARLLGEAISRLIVESGWTPGKEALLVASTDLSHFYPQRVANELDAEMLRRIGAFDPEGVIRAEDEGKGFACGRGAVAAVLFAARALGADRTQVLHYATSGDVTGDYNRVVGYGAAVIIKSEE